MLQGNQNSGLTIHDHFLDATHGARYYGRFAGHGFDVYDTEWLINGRAAEHTRMRVQLNDLILFQHLFNPDHIVTVFAGFFYAILHLFGNLRGVRCSGAQDHLRIRMQVLDGVNQVDDTLLPGDSSDKKDKGL